MNRNALMQYMATNPQNIGYYPMDDQSRQHQLDQTSAQNLMSYMNQQGDDKYWPGVGNMVTGLGAGGFGLALGATGEPWFGAPLMAAGGVQMMKGKGQYDQAQEYYGAGDMWAADPFQRK